MREVALWATSWQSKIKLNPCEAPKSRPLRGAKNRIQGCSSATADFLLEAEKRGTPPKSEKAAAFWRVGGAGRGGVQPFLRKETIESNLKNGENIADSANQIKNAESTINCHFERSKKSQNRDSLLRASTSRENDKILDCHDFATQNLAMTESNVDSANCIKFCRI
ncbi:hypothetical protein [Helicobacter sp. 23-1045]